MSDPARMTDELARTSSPARTGGAARWVPRLILTVAALHFLWAFAQPNEWAAMAREGFLAAAADQDDPDHAAREATVWFLIGGVALVALGTLAKHVLTATGRLPAQLGWYLLALGLPLCVLGFPATGGWALLAVGAFALYAARSA